MKEQIYLFRNPTNTEKLVSKVYFYVTFIRKNQKNKIEM